MKKDKIILYFTIFLMCIMLFCIVFMQFKTANQTNLTDIKNMNEDELEKEIISWQNKYLEVNIQLEDTNSKINEYEGSIFNNKEISEILNKEQEESAKLVGKTDVEGEGIVIILEDNEEQQITSNQLLSLVNELKYAGAEAISINDNRIINSTDIVDVNYIVMMEGKKISSPYEIKAIGNQTYLSSTLNAKQGLVSTYKETGITITMEENNKVQIPKYDGEIKLEYGSK